MCLCLCRRIRLRLGPEPPGRGIGPCRGGFTADGDEQQGPLRTKAIRGEANGGSGGDEEAGGHYLGGGGLKMGNDWGCRSPSQEILAMEGGWKLCMTSVVAGVRTSSRIEMRGTAMGRRGGVMILGF